MSTAAQARPTAQQIEALSVVVNAMERYGVDRVERLIGSLMIADMRRVFGERRIERQP